MIKDKALEELFLTQKPHFDDHDVFMADLTKRLDAVEFIRQYQEAAIRRYKMAMVVAFSLRQPTCRSLLSTLKQAFFFGLPKTPAPLPLQPSLWQ